MYVSMFLDGPLEEIDMMVGTERWSEYMDAVMLAYLFIVIADLSSVSLAFFRKLFSFVISTIHGGLLSESFTLQRYSGS